MYLDRTQQSVIERMKNLYASMRGRHRMKWPDEPCITFEEFEAILMPMRCCLSEVPLRWDGGLRDDFGPSIDRIGNSRGYALNNVRLVCYRIQLMRRELSDENFLTWIGRVMAVQGALE